MTYRHFTSIILLLKALGCFAQGSYTATDFITSGDFSIYRTTRYPTEPQELGVFTNNNWDYLFPESFVYDTTFAKSVSEIGLEDSFPQADVCIQDSNMYLILNHNDNKLWLLGLAATINENQIPVILPDPIDVMHFPLTVGSDISRERTVPATFTPEQLGVSAGDLGIPVEPDSIRITFEITLSSQIVGYGIFNGINGAYLEDNSQTVGYTVKVLYWGIWWPVNSLANSRTIHTLNYWMPGYGLPVCILNLNADDQVVEFRVQPPMVVSVQSPSLFGFAVYPNPARDFVVVEQVDTNLIQITDLNGKIVLKKVDCTSHTKIDISNLHSGLYILSTGTSKTKLIKH